MSKGLDALQDLRYDVSMSQDINYKIANEECDIIEKELKALVVLKDLFDFDFALRFPSNQPMLRIENKRTNEYWEIPVAQEKYDLLKEVFG